MSLPDRLAEHRPQPPIPERFTSFNVDIAYYKAFTEEILNTKGSSASASAVEAIDPALYQQWGGNLEDVRLALQNRMMGGFGHEHWRFHAEQGKRFHPRRIAVVGTGKDATIIENVLEAYGKNTEVYVFEMSGEKLEGAKETLGREAPEALGRVHFQEGNAVWTLAQQPEAFDLVEAQLLLQHQEDKDPDNRVTALRQLLQAMQTSLRYGGRLVISDLMMDDWRFETLDGHHNNGTAQKSMHRGNATIHGDVDDGGTYKGLLELGWGTKEGRGAHAWVSKDELSDKVLLYTQLQPVESVHESRFDITPGMTVLTDLMPATITLGMTNALSAIRKAYESNPSDALRTMIERLEQNIEASWEQSRTFHESCYATGVGPRMPNLDFFVFEKTPLPVDQIPLETPV